MNNRIWPPTPPKLETNGVAAAVVNWFRILYWATLHMYIYCFIEGVGYFDIHWRPRTFVSENRGVLEDRAQRLIRWDLRPPNHVFHHGFYPWVSDSFVDFHNTNLYDYVEDGIPNIYVSTTRTLYNREGQPIETWVPNERNTTHFYEYEIYAPGGIDVNATLGERSPFPDQQEIAFPGGIHRRFIRSVRQYHHGQLIRIWLNPHFEGTLEQPAIQATHDTEFLWWFENHPQGGERNNDNIPNSRGMTNMDIFNPDSLMKGQNGKKSTQLDTPELETRRLLANGDYFIKTFQDPSLLIELKTDRGEEAKLDRVDGSLVNKQKWSLKYDEHSGCYRIITNVNNSKMALVFSSLNEDIFLEEVSDSSEQLLGITKLKTGEFQIVKYREFHMTPMRALGVNDSDNTLKHYPINDVSNSRWSFEEADREPLENGVYRITTNKDHHVMWSAKNNGSMVNGSESLDIDAISGVGSTEELFEFEKVESGYRIYHKKEDEKYMIVPQNSLSGVEPTFSGGNWLLDKHRDGSFSILYVDIYNRSQALTFLSQDRRTISLRPYRADENQKWRLFTAYDNAKFENEYLIYSNGAKNSVIGYQENSQDLIVQEINYNEFQKWKLSYDENKFAYQIVSVADSSLNITYNYRSNQIIVGQGKDKENFWYIQTTRGGMLLFRNKLRSDILITLSGNSILAGNLSLHSNSIQEFGLIPIKTTDSIGDGRYLINSVIQDERSLTWRNQRDTIIDHAIFHLEAEWDLKYSESRKSYTILNANYRRDGLYFSHLGDDACKKEIIEQELKQSSIDEVNRKFWYLEFRHESGCYVIRNKFNPNIIVSRSDETLNSRVITTYISNTETIPNDCLWQINRVPR